MLMQAFDHSHMQADWRDYAIQRARHLLYSLHGTAAHDVTSVLAARAGGKLHHGISVTLIADILAMLDARDSFVIKEKVHGQEMVMGSDPCENFFNVLTGQAGYSPTMKDATAKMQGVEDESTRRFDTRHTLPNSGRSKRHMPQMRRMRRRDWNSGRRMKFWWRSQPRQASAGADGGPTRTIRRSHVRERGVRRCAAGKRTSVRDFFLSKSYNSILNAG